MHTSIAYEFSYLNSYIKSYEYTFFIWCIKKDIIGWDVCS